MRLERPARLYAFYFPHLIGRGSTYVVDPLPSFIVGYVVLRGAACAWNDKVDQDFDRKVVRCRLRPIAWGAVTTTRGHLFTAALTLAGLPLFTLLPLECAYHAVPITFIFAFYPFAKRLTYCPQVVLGFPFAWANLMCCAAFGVDSFSRLLFYPTTSLFAAHVLWTVIYDTIYAHQRTKDDVKAGVKSMAIRFANHTKLLASILATAQVILLIATGWLTELPPVYFILTCGGGGIALVSMIVQVNLSQPASCAWWFHRGFWSVGGCVAAGFFSQYLEGYLKARHTSPY